MDHHSSPLHNNWIGYDNFTFRWALYFIYFADKSIYWITLQKCLPQILMRYFNQFPYVQEQNFQRKFPLEIIEKKIVWSTEMIIAFKIIRVDLCFYAFSFAIAKIHFFKVTFQSKSKKKKNSFLISQTDFPTYSTNNEKLNKIRQLTSSKRCCG